ncbi:MAG TPA: protease modulator HflC [Thermoguttaceae bacterium]|nr:protease modulator HflC [Thermoguttaceae bacterium]
MSNRQRLLLIVAIAVLLLAFPLGRSIMFTVNERELAVVLRFGEPIVDYTEPGLKFKMPLIDEVRRLPKTHQFWIGTGTEILVDVTTADLKKIEVTSWAIWRITDPKQFVKFLRTTETAESRVKDIVRNGIRYAIRSYNLAEVVRSTERELTYTFQVESPERSKTAGEPGPDGHREERRTSGISGLRQPGADEPIEVGRKRIVEEVKNAVEKRLRGDAPKKAGKTEEAGKTENADQAVRGIELVDVGVAKIDFVDIVRDAAFQRLIAFMESIAQKNEADGERAKTEILNQTDAEVQQIEGEGKGEANKIQGEADAQIIQMYADAIRQTGEFYGFVRTLEAYKKAVGSNTRLILTTDSDMFKMLKTMPPVSPSPPGEASTEESPTKSEAAQPKATEKPPAEKPSP